jgi:hypothetical protein
MPNSNHDSKGRFASGSSGGAPSLKGRTRNADVISQAAGENTLLLGTSRKASEVFKALRADGFELKRETETLMSVRGADMDTTEDLIYVHHDGNRIISVSRGSSSRTFKPNAAAIHKAAKPKMDKAVVNAHLDARYEKESNKLKRSKKYGSDAAGFNFK